MSGFLTCFKQISFYFQKTLPLEEGLVDSWSWTHRCNLESMNIEEAEQSRGLWRIKCSHVMIIVISVLSLVSLPSLPKPKGLEYKHRHQLILLYLLYFSLTYLTHYSDFCLSFLNTHCFVNLTHISLMQFVSLLPHVGGVAHTEAPLTTPCS